MVENNEQLICLENEVKNDGRPFAYSRKIAEVAKTYNFCDSSSSSFLMESLLVSPAELIFFSRKSSPGQSVERSRGISNVWKIDFNRFCGIAVKYWISESIQLNFISENHYS